MGTGVALADLLAEALARPASRRSSCAGSWLLATTPTGLPEGLPPWRALSRAGGLGDTWGKWSVIPEEATMVEIGDRILVESEKVGSAVRSGVVTAVDDRLITVRWDSGSESIFVPSAGSLRVIGHEPPAAKVDNS
jgi:hypothetical protein